MRYRIEFRPAAVRNLASLDPFIRRKVVADIEKLAGNPRPPGVEKLAAKEKLYRVYAGRGNDYRVLYQIQDEALLIVVVKVGDRKDVYRGVK